MNSRLNTILFVFLLIIMLGVGGWLAYNAYQLKLKTENAGEELFFIAPDKSYSITWYGETYLVDVTVKEQENQIAIVNSGGETIYSFDKSLYSGDESEFNKTCDSIRIETGQNKTDKVTIYGINCK